MRHPACILAASLLLAATSLASAKPAYVASAVNLRAAPGTTNEIVAKIPGGSLIDANNCTNGWCAVTWQDKNGFAIESALDLSGRVPARTAHSFRDRGPAYVEDGYVPAPPPGYYEPGPVYYYGFYGPHYRRGWGWRHW